MDGIELGFGVSSEGLELGLGQIAECDDVDAADCPKPPKGRSIAHNVLTDGSAVFLFFDIEISGEYAGIIQLLAELVWLKLVAGRGVAQYQLEEVARVDTFDSYVKPDCNIWDQRCIDIHQINPDGECIVSAHNIDHVWGQFKTWLNCHVGISETVIFVAWNGETCDLKWLWKITQASWSRLSFPPQIQFFIDPYRLITGFKLCPLDKSKSKLEGYDLGSMWKYFEGQNLNGAHNSLVDVKAQTDILINKMFVGFINRTASIQTVDAIFSTTQKNDWRKEMEPE